MRTLSNQSSGGETVSPAGYLEKVYEMYRRSRHFNLKITQEKIYTMSLAEIQKYSILVVQEAFRLYDLKGKPRPHPNYFMAICRRIQREGIKNIDTKQNFGKII